MRSTKAKFGNRRKVALLAVVTASAAMTGSVFADPDGTLLSINNGKTWGSTALWENGEVVSGNGVVIDTGTGSPQVLMDETNRVVGSFTTTRGKMPRSSDNGATGGNFRIGVNALGFEHTLDFTPQRVDSTTGYVLTTNRLIFANNGSPAEIRIDDSVGDGGGTARQPFRHFYDVPITLEDDLAIRHLADSTNSLGQYGSLGNVEKPAAGVIFSRPISGDGKGISIYNAAALLGVMFMADNTFSGDLVVERGIARAWDTVDRGRVGTPFGVDNSVVATNDNAGVDLGGFVTGEGQTLVIKGKRVANSNVAGTSTVTNGVLFSSCGRPDKTAEWRGDVVLKGDTWLGGRISWNNFYPAAYAGDILVSGDISESDGPAAVHIVPNRNVVFSGNNTFSGRLWLDSDRGNGQTPYACLFTARSPASVGTGGIVFNGGAYRMSSNDDANVLEMNVVSAPGGVRLHVDGGVTNVLPCDSTAWGMAHFYKTGEGTLVLTNAVALSGKQAYIYGGTVVYDTSNADYVKFGAGQNDSNVDYVRLFLDPKLVVRGDPNHQRMASFYGIINDGCAATIRAEDGQGIRISPDYNNSKLPAFINLETDGSGAYIKTNTKPNGHTYLGNHVPMFVYEGSSFATTGSVVNAANYRVIPMPDESYSSTWGGATDCVDVTPALAATTVPDGIVADVLRFNTPNGGSELVLTLGGDLTLAGRTILVTPAMGNTTVRITGGKLRTESINSTSAAVLRILNFNTNASIIVESDIDIAESSANKNRRVVTGGPGKTVLSGPKSCNSADVYVIGGELEVNHPDSFGAGASTYYKAHIYNGGILSFAGTFDPVADATNAGSLNSFSTVVHMSGGAVKVPNASDVVTLSTCTKSKQKCGISIYAGARFRKLGPGTLRFNPGGLATGPEECICPEIVHPEFFEGTVEDVDRLASAQFREVGNGVKLVGKSWLMADCNYAFGGGDRMEISYPMLHIGPGGATVDVRGENVTINDQNGFYGVDRCPEFLSGEGELTVTDSVGGAVLKAWHYRDASFRGKFTSYVPFNAISGLSGSLELRNAEMHIPSGVTHYFNYVYHDRCNLRFGRLSGEGTLHVIGAQANMPAYVILGQDDAPDADFAGTLILTNNTVAYPQLLKVGSNAQRISGGANELYGNVIVRAGALLAGNDSLGTQGAGAFGAAMVFVGDEETPAGASPAFLADGAFTVANEIRVPDTSPASAVPVLGGTTNANGAVFSGPVKLRRDVAFMAGEGATVTFIGEISGLQGVSMRGGGRVVIDGDVDLGGDFAWAGGTLEATGRVTVPAGATLTMDESLCTRENRDKVFVLLKATGGIDGRFECPQTLPANWRISQKADSIRLSGISGFSIFVR